jgi:UDP-glucuronate 4-epimerase
MRVLITGVAGFIGSHLAERMIGLGWDVTGVDSFDPFYDPAVKRRNLAACLTSPRFQLIEADIRDAEAMDRAMDSAHDAVIHLAARAGVRPSIAEPLVYADVNITGTVVLLEAARRHGAGRFLFASSSSVYGNAKKVPFSEEDNVDCPVSPYAATKKAGELICYTYHHLYRLNVTSLRFFTVYGPRQRPDLAIHKFARLIEQGQPVPVFGDGSMTRDFTYIEDILDGIGAALDRCAGYHLYNLGESQPVSVNTLIAEMEAALGKKAQRQTLPLQPGDVDRTFADLARARQDLGYQPKTSIQEGLRRFVEWFRRESSAGR